MSVGTGVIKGTPERILMGKAKGPSGTLWRVERDVGEPAEFGFAWALVGSAVSGLLGIGGQAYTQQKIAQEQAKAAKAQAEAAARAAEARASAFSETMQTLAPVFALVAVGGIITAVLLVKRKKGKVQS